MDAVRRGFDRVVRELGPWDLCSRLRDRRGKEGHVYMHLLCGVASTICSGTWDVDRQIQSL